LPVQRLPVDHEGIAPRSALTFVQISLSRILPLDIKALEQQMTSKSDGYPLAGLKVLDFSRVLAGPFAGRMLCDLGADVVKVEPPDGDITRLWGRRIANIPGYYHQQNAGKRDICIDFSIRSWL